MTHNDIVTVLGAGLALVVFMLGYWRGHWRAYAECCDCCTCQTCEPPEPELFRKLGRGIGGSFTEDGTIIEQWHRDGPDEPKVYDVRRTVVLEPGPTIYPALAEMAGEVMDEPESHPDASDSTFVRRLLIEWEQRYPIPVGAP